MNDNEIIKALNCCASGACAECPRVNNPVNVLMCQGDLICEALDLINRQQAEIERLEERIIEVQRCDKELIETLHKVHEEKIETAKSEAIKEFAERFLKIVHDNHYLLVDRINSKDYGMFTIGIEQAVDETKKEMVGDTE